MGTLSNTYLGLDIGNTLSGFCVLSSTLAVGVIDISGSLYIRVYTISGTTVTAEVSLTLISNAVGISAFGGDFTIAAISSTTFVVAYSISSGYCYAIAGTVSGTTVTLGSGVNVSGVNVSGVFSITNVNTDSYVISYMASGGSVMLKAGTISTRTITQGTAVQGYSSTSNGGTVFRTSATSFMLYVNDVNTNVVLRPATLSTRTITVNTQNTNTSLYSYGLNKYALFSATSFIILVSDSVGSIGISVCSTDNSTVTMGSLQSLIALPGINEYFTNLIFFPLSTTQILTCYNNAADYVRAVTLTFSSNVMSIDSNSIEMESATPTFSYLSGGVLTSGSKWLLTYLGQSSTKESSQVITYTESVGKKWNGLTISKWNGVSPNKINGI